NEFKVKCPRCQQELVIGLYIPKEAYQNTKPPVDTKDLEAIFNPDIAKHLKFTRKDDNTITITPTRYLGKENFLKIAKQVKTLGGDYVSQGKNSYFWIPIQNIKTKTPRK
ncbi:MAG: hypothetical protein QXH87_02430, partial [Candidatus Bathyarchaeia archaeon]